MARQSIAMFLLQLSYPYDSIFTVGLGATAIQLGLVHSIGLAMGALLSPLAGLLIDRYGLKKVFLAAVALLILSPLFYSIAWRWEIVIFAMLFYYAGFRMGGTSCTTVCATSLSNVDRAKSMATCETMGAGAGLIAPLVGAVLVSIFGGVNVDGIRPLYYIRFAGYILMFGFIALTLVGIPPRKMIRHRTNYLKDFGELFQSGKNLKRWLLISSVMWLPVTVILPFTSWYANEVKGAQEYVLGGMAAGAVLTQIVTAVPVGQLADRIGRKKVLYLMAPLCYASNLLLIFAPNPATLIIAGCLQGFYIVSMVVSGAMGAELVPHDQMGRWQGLLGLLCRGLMSAPMPVLGGVIWVTVGPSYVFVALIAIDLCIRIPALIGMPETLRAPQNRGRAQGRG